MEIKATVHDEEVRRLMGKVAERVGNLRPVMRDIGEEYTRRVDDRFVSQTDPDGNPWARLSSVTLQLALGRLRGGFKKSGYLGAAGRRYLEGKRILQQSGALRGDIHYQHNADSVSIGTSGRIPYAGIQQFGGMAGRGRKVSIPARPYLARNAGDEMEVAPSDRDMVMLRITAYLLS